MIVKVLTRFDHDGIVYEPGKTLELSDGVAQPAIDVGALEEVKEAEGEVEKPEESGALSKSKMKRMKLDDLKEYADAQGVEYPEDVTKKALIEAIANPAPTDEEPEAEDEGEEEPAE